MASEPLSPRLIISDVWPGRLRLTFELPDRTIELELSPGLRRVLDAARFPFGEGYPREGVSIVKDGAEVGRVDGVLELTTEDLQLLEHGGDGHPPDLCVRGAGLDLDVRMDLDLGRLPPEHWSAEDDMDVGERTALADGLNVGAKDGQGEAVAQLALEHDQDPSVVGSDTAVGRPAESAQGGLGGDGGVR